VALAEYYESTSHELLNVLLRHALKMEAESSFEIFVSMYVFIEVVYCSLVVELW
jgi:hypothetical protein